MLLCVYWHTIPFILFYFIFPFFGVGRDGDAWIELFVSPNQGITLYVSLLQDIRRELGISIIREEKVQLQKVAVLFSFHLRCGICLGICFSFFYTIFPLNRQMLKHVKNVATMSIHIIPDRYSTNAQSSNCLLFLLLIFPVI